MWPPRGLCKHQCKSHLHSARVDPPCLKGVHLSPQSLSGHRPRKACIRGPGTDFRHSASQAVSVNTARREGRMLPAGTVSRSASGVKWCRSCAPSQAAGQWPCSDVWRGVGDTVSDKIIHKSQARIDFRSSCGLGYIIKMHPAKCERPIYIPLPYNSVSHETTKGNPSPARYLALSLSGSFSFSFFRLFFHQNKTSHARGHFGLVGLARLTTVHFVSVGKSSSRNLRPYRHFGLSGLRNQHYFFDTSHFPVPGFHNTFSAHLGPFNIIGQILLKIYTPKFTRKRVNFLHVFLECKLITLFFACKFRERVKLHAKDLTGIRTEARIARL